MCWATSEHHIDEINGTCYMCGEDTVNEKAYEVCDYSPVECDDCGYAPCDGSC